MLTELCPAIKWLNILCTVLNMGPAASASKVSQSVLARKPKVPDSQILTPALSFCLVHQPGLNLSCEGELQGSGKWVEGTVSKHSEILREAVSS